MLASCLVNSQPSPKSEIPKNVVRIEVKWAIYFSLMTLAWMLLEKLVGLHGKYIDYHIYLTNLFAIPAIAFMVFALDRKSTRLNSSHVKISYAVFCLKKKIYRLVII